MKKLLSVVTLLGTLAGAASAAPYVLPTAGGALTPYDWQPVYSIEGTYTLGDHSYDPDMWGVRGSLSLYSNAQSSVRHQFNLNLGFMTGDAKSGNLKADGTLIPVTLGYNLNLGITDDVFFYLGGKAGYAFADFDIKQNGVKVDELKDGGFTYSVGAGFKVQCSDSVYVHAGYEFGRTFIETDGDGHAIISGHSVIIGVGWTF